LGWERCPHTPARYLGTHNPTSSRYKVLDPELYFICLFKGWTPTQNTLDLDSFSLVLVCLKYEIVNFLQRILITTFKIICLVEESYSRQQMIEKNLLKKKKKKKLMMMMMMMLMILQVNVNKPSYNKVIRKTLFAGIQKFFLARQAVSINQRSTSNPQKEAGFCLSTYTYNYSPNR